MATLDPSIREALNRRIIAAGRQAFGDYFRGAILKGSAYKGDFIPYFSDYDVHTFVDDAAMAGPRIPAIEYALAFQEAFGDVLPRDYQVNQCQIYFIAWNQYPLDWVKPLPASYTIIYGDLPPGFTDYTQDDRQHYIQKSHEDIGLYTRYCDGLIDRMVDKPNEDLPPLARLAGTFLKPMPYMVATVAGHDPEYVWKLRLADVLAIAEPLACPDRLISAYFAQVQPWPPDPDRARNLIRLAYKAAQQIYAWYTASPYSMQGSLA